MARQVCPECGNVCSDTDEFCSKCGREFTPQDKKQNPFAQFTPAAIPDLPSEDLMKKGFELIANDCYTDAMAYWTKAVKQGTVPDDETYASMVSETGAAMLRISEGSSVSVRKGAGDLSLVLDDRDFSDDLLKEYARRVPDCSGQVMLVNLSTNYMILMVECFGVYTDIRDLKELCTDAGAFLDAVLAREEELKDDGTLEPAKALRYINTNVEYNKALLDGIGRAMASLDEARMEELADKWASNNMIIMQVQHLMAALKASVDTRVAGKLSIRIMLKVRDSEINAFLTHYLAGQ